MIFLVQSYTVVPGYIAPCTFVTPKLTNVLLKTNIEVIYFYNISITHVQAFYKSLDCQFGLLLQRDPAYSLFIYLRNIALDDSKNKRVLKKTLSSSRTVLGRGPPNAW